MFGYCSGRRRVAGAVAAVLLLAGCVEDPANARHERTMLAFGTIIDVEVFGDELIAQAALDVVDAYFQTLHEDWYAFGRGELGRANQQLAQGQNAEVSTELAALIRRALALRQVSRGTFDPTVGDLVKLWGFADAESLRTRPPSETEVTRWLNDAAFRNSFQLRGRRLIVDGPVTLDLSAMAKGAALEGAAKLLLEHGIENAVIDAGGDIKVLGSHLKRRWRIGIRHPRENTSMATVTLQPGEAIVSSGDYQRFFNHQQRRYHHIIDPRTGKPVDHTIAVTVIAHDAALADVAATALMVGGATQFYTLTASLGVDTALLITRDGKLVMTAGMSSRLAPPPGRTGQVGDSVRL